MREVGVLVQGREIRPGDVLGNSRVLRVDGDSCGVNVVLRNVWGPNLVERVWDNEHVVVTRLEAA